MVISIKEIAELASTSRGTVDRVLHNRGYVSQEKKDLILKIAKDYNYTPNISAKLLANSNKKKNIGVIINSIGNAFYDKVLYGINKEKVKLESHNVGVKIIELKGYSVSDQISAINKLVEEGINALAITPIDSIDIAKKIEELRLLGIPSIFINSDLDHCERLSMIGANNTESGQLAAGLAQLVLNKDSKVLIVTGNHSNLGNKKRVNAFSKVLKEREIKVLEVLESEDDDKICSDVVFKSLKKYQYIDLIYFCGGGIDGGIKTLNELKFKGKILTVDESDIIKKSLEDGFNIATITQDPIQQGKIPLKILLNYLVFGEEIINTKVYTENRIIMKYNNK